MLDESQRSLVLIAIERALAIPPGSVARRMLEGATPLLRGSRDVPTGAGWLFAPYLLPVWCVARGIELGQRLGERKAQRGQVQALRDYARGREPRRIFVDEGAAELLLRCSVVAPTSWDPARCYEGVALLARRGDTPRLLRLAAGRAAVRRMDECFAEVQEALAACLKRPAAAQSWRWRLQDLGSLIVD